MLRVISRPRTVPAERIALLNAGLSTTFSNMLGSAAFRDFISPSAGGRPAGASTGGGSGALSGGGANRALRRSYADSRATGWPYSARHGDALAAAAIASGPMVSISDRGARIRVHATGVGAPFSDSTVTIASPMPSDVNADSRS